MTREGRSFNSDDLVTRRAPLVSRKAAATPHKLGNDLSLSSAWQQPIASAQTPTSAPNRSCISLRILRVRIVCHEYKACRPRPAAGTSGGTTARRPHHSRSWCVVRPERSVASEAWTRCIYDGYHAHHNGAIPNGNTEAHQKCMALDWTTLTSAGQARAAADEPAVWPQAAGRRGAAFGAMPTRPPYRGRESGFRPGSRLPCGDQRPHRVEDEHRRHLIGG
jgi:hypothetical protein